MKTNTLKLVISFILILIVSCDEPETVVTDIVHPDGSVTRKIEMKSLAKEFKTSDLQVPFDTTWSVRDSIEFQGHNDTIYVKRAEKLFKNTDELNQSYIADSSGNREARRRTEFRKSFRWFHSEYRFAEIIEKRLDNGYPVSDFLNAEELKWFYSPDNLTEELKEGADSLKYRALNDSVNKRTDYWITKCMASEWSAEFLRQVGGRGGEDLSKESLKAREDRFVTLIANQGRDLDSLWNNGIILREFLGEENGKKFQTEADSAASVVAERIFFNFDDYTLRMIMPGKVISSNGFVDSTGVLRWPVKSDYFMTEPYSMWAESKTPENWAWIVTGIFLLFVLGGIIFRAMRK
jgi:hypothetical protein